jgi:hypothetical protein
MTYLESYISIDNLQLFNQTFNTNYVFDHKEEDLELFDNFLNLDSVKKPNSQISRQNK